MAEVVEDLAGLDDPWVNDAVEDIESVTAGHDKAVMAHESEMLRKVGLWEAGGFEQFLDRSLLFLKDIEDFEPFRVRKDLIYEGVLLVRLAGEG